MPNGFGIKSGCLPMVTLLVEQGININFVVEITPKQQKTFFNKYFSSSPDNLLLVFRT